MPGSPAPPAGPRGAGARHGWALVLAASLVAFAGPATAQGPAGATLEPGAELEVYLMTMGVGDAVWERFGHNALGIRDRATNTDVVYNWGTFSFTETDFLPRFIRGENRYWVAANDARLTIAYYESINRSVQVQELALPPATRLAIRDFVEWNAREENRYYRYDYFIDNCSTRVRDALDKALGGALTRQFGGGSGMSFRDEARRLMEPDALTYTGIDIGLGTPSDREMTRYESAFIPMRLRDLLREARIPDASGALVPLVAAEREVFMASRSPEAPSPVDHRLRFLLIGLVIGALVLGLAVVAPRGARVTATVWCTVSGILGLLITGLWTLTRHVWAYENVNILFFNPLWFALAVLVARRAAPGVNGRRLALLCGVLAAVGLALGLARVPQRSEQVALLVLAPHAAVLSLLLRRRAA